ncbi:MAG: tRNA pseudouridine(55) synthase TruB [Elusimicrobiota bacterium]
MSLPGFLLLDKPSGPTSHDIVEWARRALGDKRVGHCGTLDPMARGLLILGVAGALKRQESVSALRKTYRGRFRLGLSTDTDDVTGRVLEKRDASAVSAEDLRACFGRFLGRQEQKVPRFSAVKVGGKRLYELARAGEIFELPSKPVEIYRFDLLSYAPPEAEFLAECSKGTYVRSLARDAGDLLGVGAALSDLSREAVGPFRLSRAHPWRPGPPVMADLMRSFLPLAEFEAALAEYKP